MKDPADRTLRTLLLSGATAALLGTLMTGCSLPGLRSGPPARATSAYAAGVLAYNRGDISAAKTELKTATQEAPELIKARSLLGDLFRAEGDYKAALEQYEAVVKLDPYSSTSFVKLGIAYQFLERFLEARDSYVKALTLSPRSVDAHMNLGLVYLALGDLPKAMEHSKQAATLAPDNATALANYGVVLDAVGDSVGAERAFLSSLEISGDSQATLLNLGQNLLIQNRGPEAQEVLSRLVARHDSSIARKRLGDAYALQGRAADAIAEYERSLKIDPAYYPAMNDAGRVIISKYRAGLELDEGLRATALNYWRRSLKVKPTQPQIQALLTQWDRHRS